MESECKSGATSHGYCRLHYIKNWKIIKFSTKIKAERRLNSYIDRLAKKFPEEYLEKLKEGLQDEEKFNQSVQELELEGEDREETEEEFLEKFIRDIKIDE